jgi:hypothetical protein
MAVQWPRTEYVHDTFYVADSFHAADIAHLRYDISKNCWPRCADVLAKQNVKLTDDKGCFWRTRLTK